MKHRIDILERQEQLLRFDRFCQSDALALGNLMARRAQDAGQVVAISIRLANGAILFQYLPDGTNALNEYWLRRKFNTVVTMTGSSLKEAFSLEEAIAGYTAEAAPASFDENKKGKILPGYLADFVILSADPFKTDPMKLSQIRVRETWIGGKRVK